MTRRTNEAVCIYIARVAGRSAGEDVRMTCFLPAPSVSEAERRLPPALAEAGIELVQTDFLKSYWDYEWTSARDQKAFDALAEEAYRSRALVVHPA